jgi:hypothetical protein
MHEKNHKSALKNKKKIFNGFIFFIQKFLKIFKKYFKLRKNHKKCIKIFFRIFAKFNDVFSLLVLLRAPVPGGAAVLAEILAALLKKAKMLLPAKKLLQPKKFLQTKKMKQTKQLTQAKQL